MYRYPRQGLPRGQNSCRSIRGPGSGPRDEDQVDLEAVEPGRQRLRVPENAHKARHGDDRHRLYRAQLRQRVHPRLSAAVQVQQRGGRGGGSLRVLISPFSSFILRMRSI